MKSFDTVSVSFCGHPHNHGHCIQSALDAADRLCEERKVKLTAIRRRVLELVWQNHNPVGAYDVLSLLSAESGKTAPPTVYRALEFLLEQGFIHRIESQNAYVGCAHPDKAHAGMFLICRNCGSAAEVHDEAIGRALARKTETLGFQAEKQTIEIEGLCPDCQKRGDWPEEQDLQ